MVLRVLRFVFLLCACLGGAALPAQTGESPLRYSGTVGEQRVAFLLEVSGDRVSGGHYTYRGQKSEVRIVDSRQFGTTVVLQDEDGNILHLHFQSASGEKTGSFASAAMLEGTLDREELDLPVRLTREPQPQPRP